MNFKFFSKNGELRPIDEATVSLSNIEYQYGFGVYETVRVVHGLPLFLDDHLDRLEESARTIGISHTFDAKFVARSIHELIAKNTVDTCNLKILLVGGSEPMLSIICLNPLFPDKKLYRDGVSLLTYPYERAFPHAKSLNMLQSYLAYQKARAAGCYDALLTSSKGNIFEGTRTNFFCLKGTEIVSPPEAEILLGVTRKNVLRVAKENGFSLSEKDIPVSDVTNYDCAFITSTSSKILPVRSIDSQTLRDASPELRKLMDAFGAFLRKCEKKLTESTES